MASWKSVILAIFLFLAIAYSAPSPQSTIDGVIKIPEECRGPGFCAIKPEGYELLEEKINSILPDFLREANRTNPDIPPPTLSPESDWDNCPYITERQLPYSYTQYKTNKTDIIIQTPLFYQVVESVKCAYNLISDSDNQCYQLLDLRPFGYKSTCETTYSQRALYVYEIENNEIVQKQYYAPSCCSCKLTQVWLTMANE